MNNWYNKQPWYWFFTNSNIYSKFLPLEKRYTRKKNGRKWSSHETRPNHHRSTEHFTIIWFSLIIFFIKIYETNRRCRLSMYEVQNNRFFSAKIMHVFASNVDRKILFRPFIDLRKNFSFCRAVYCITLPARSNLWWWANTRIHNFNIAVNRFILFNRLLLLYRCCCCCCRNYSFIWISFTIAQQFLSLTSFLST